MGKALSVFEIVMKNVDETEKNYSLQSLSITISRVLSQAKTWVLQKTWGEVPFLVH